MNHEKYYHNFSLYISLKQEIVIQRNSDWYVPNLLVK